MCAGRRLSALVGSLAVALVLAGCAGTDGARGPGEGGSQAGATRTASRPDPAGTAAADLRAKLTTVLHEHTSIVALVTQSGIESGMDSTQTHAAIEALHHSGESLVRTVRMAAEGSDNISGQDEVQRFRTLWEEHTRYLIDYIKGAVKGDDTLTTVAETELAHVDSELAIVLDDLTDHVFHEPEAATLLSSQATAVTDAVDAIAAKEAGAPEAVVQAGRHSEETAEALARGLAVAAIHKVPGSAMTPAATLRARLTGLLAEHVGQAFVLTQVAQSSGTGSERTKTATEAMHATTDDLVSEIRHAYGSKTARQFARVFDEHVQALIDYAKSRATGSGRGAAPSSTSYARELASLIGQASRGGVSDQELEAALNEQVRHVEDAIDALAKDAPDAGTTMEGAVKAVAEPARLLAVAAR